MVNIFILVMHYWFSTGYSLLEKGGGVVRQEQEGGMVGRRE